MCSLASPRLATSVVAVVAVVAVIAVVALVAVVAEVAVVAVVGVVAVVAVAVVVLEDTDGRFLADVAVPKGSCKKGGFLCISC